MPENLIFVPFNLMVSPSIIPNRAFEFYDLFANSVGVAVSFFLIRLLKGLKIIY